MKDATRKKKSSASRDIVSNRIVIVERDISTFSFLLLRSVQIEQKLGISET